MQKGYAKFTPSFSPIKHKLTSIRSVENLTTGINSPSPSANTKNFEKYEVIVQNQFLENQLKLIEWRSKTDLPIVKILFYKILQKKLLNECSVLQVAIQCYPCNLNSLPIMPLYQLLYLIKESLIGLQHLYDRFGPFDVSNKMVLITKNSKCRVWINQNITLNFPSRKNKRNQKEFLLSIVKIFEEKCLKSVLSGEFFINLRKNSGLLEAVGYIETFIKTYKIVLPNKLNSLTQSLGSKRFLEKHETNMEKFQDCINNRETIRKTPKFIAQVKQPKRVSKEKEFCNKSFGSPCKTISKLQIRDRSQNKIKIPFPKSIKYFDSSMSNTPKSPGSVDWNLETKSNNDKRFIKPELTIKRNSDNDMKFSPFKPIKFATEKVIHKQERMQRNNQELFYTKVPNTKPQPKVRKFSTNCEEKSAFIYSQAKRAEKTQKKVEYNVHCSQQTAATMDEHKNRSKLMQKFNKLSHPTAALQIDSLLEDQDSSAIYEKNKWVRRMNTLNSENIRETIQSQDDGVQQFSSQIVLANENLSLLSTMGKTLKKSITQQQ